MNFMKKIMMLVMSVSIISYDNYYRYSVLEEKKDVLSRVLYPLRRDIKLVLRPDIDGELAVIECAMEINR